MASSSASRPALPRQLNLGSGKDFRDDFFNIDVDDTWAPDAVCDLSADHDLARGIPLQTRRFGEVTLARHAFDQIIANDVLEHVPNLMKLMTACLELLEVGGVFHISVPYDLSFGAWQDPTHVRAFNERSWLYYTDWFWYMSWADFRFALAKLDFVPSDLGQELKSRSMPRDEIVRTPRAIDSMSVTLQKVALTAQDRQTWRFWRERRLAAQQRKQGPLQPGSSPSVTSERPVASSDIVSFPAAERLKAFDGPLSNHLHRYAVWIVTPGGYQHQHAMDDVALALSEAFKELGGSAPVIRDPTEASGRDLIILGPQLLPPSASELLARTSVLFNLEQVQKDTPWMSEAYLDLLRSRPVLDYSGRNLVSLAELGITHARLLPLGYAPGLSRIARSDRKDIDVLFYGSLNERRRAVLEQLEAAGLKVVHLFGVYGGERDDAIARAKVVLNMHFYDAAIFEAVRVTFLLANEVCVVTEGDSDDCDLAPLKTGMIVAPYHDLVGHCLRLVSDVEQSARLASAGLSAIKQRRQADLLSRLFDN